MRNSKTTMSARKSPFNAVPARSARPLTRQTGAKRPATRKQTAQLRQELAEVKAELASVKVRQKWLETTLDTQRHARQVLEAAVSSTYAESILRIRDVVRAAVPHDAIVLVVSKGDEELLKLDGRRGWHFPQDDSGEYAGYHPADSAAAIEHLQRLVARGGQFLLLPSTAFWWLEHYRGFEEHLDRFHLRIWRDDRCALYLLRREAEPTRSQPTEPRPGAAVARIDPSLLPVSADGRDILCFPVINWDYRFQRPQQLMRQFAAAGHRVFYLSHEWRASGEPCLLRSLGANLHEVSLRGSRFKVRQGVIDPDSRQALVASLGALQRNCTPGAILAMVQSPFWWPIVRECAAKYSWPLVYDCLDYHAGFATSNPLIEEQERELLVRANLVIASSAALEARARRYNRRVLLLRNGCDYEHFTRVPPKPRGARPVIGYYGAIAEWFDVELVAELAKQRTDWQFILVGSTFGADTRRLTKLPNVLVAGEKSYVEIPDWLARFDVTMLPFKHTPLTEATNPVKVYEILAAGKPLVSVPLPEMLLLAPLVRLASGTLGFEREIEAELALSDPAHEARRRAFAKENTWKRRFETLSSALRPVFTNANIEVSRFDASPERATHGNRL